YGRQSMRLKGTHLVKKACENLHKKGFNIKLLLFDTITDDNIKADIDSFTSTCPFEFVVNHPVEKNYELYHRASAFASAERKGTWANTASEAMACGVPVVASGVGSDDFLIHGETGLRVGLSSRSIEKALKKLYLDQEFQNRAVEAGIRRVRQYQWRFSADHILALCQRPDAYTMYESHW
ncbi:MAG: glycosyltransferase family 4 protein, partial [Proteobacteria bacterium]|nr:glycosyltransferase family 4 protein [Pseudomonadota bacterium]